MNPLTVFASVGEQLTLPEGGGSMWKTITDGSGQFITGVVTPVSNFVADSEVALGFLSVTFLGLAVRIFSRMIRSLGRGH